MATVTSGATACPTCGFSSVSPMQFCTMCGTPLRGSGVGRRHSPLVALILAILIPGAGQAYNGQPVKGFFILFFSVLILPWIYSLYDAWAVARNVRDSGGRMGRGGWIWVFLQLWLAANVVLLSLIILTLMGRLK